MLPKPKLLVVSRSHDRWVCLDPSNKPREPASPNPPTSFLVADYYYSKSFRRIRLDSKPWEATPLPPPLFSRFPFGLYLFFLFFFFTKSQLAEWFYRQNIGVFCGVRFQIIYRSLLFSFVFIKRPLTSFGTSGASFEQRNVVQTSLNVFCCLKRSEQKSLPDF